jgi:signal transduction histidine kinase
MLSLIPIHNTVDENVWLDWKHEFGETDFVETMNYQTDYFILKVAMNTVLDYQSEQNILSGNTVSQSDIDAVVQNLYNNVQSTLYNDIDMMGLSSDERDKMLWDVFQNEYKDDIDNAKNVVERNQLTSFREAIERIKSNSNIKYYINAGGNVISNDTLWGITSDKNSYQRTVFSEDGRSVGSEGAFVFDQSYINDKDTQLLSIKSVINTNIILGSICLVLWLFCLIYLIFAAGKKSIDPQGIHHISVDKLFNEITLAMLFLCCAAVAGCVYLLFLNLFYEIFLVLLLAAAVELLIACILILVRHIKSHSLFTHTIIFTLFRLIFRFIKNIYNAGKPMVKAFVLVAILGVLTAIPFVFILSIPLALIFTYFQVKKYLTIKNGVKLIKNGIYNQNIEVAGKGEIASLSADINSISSGLATEVECRLKSERLKTELIVNVSHDIRTPLTSVITYVDLLEKEDIQNENARKYINVIAGKSNRLKTLIDDLFEASKAASGSIAVNCDNVDLGELVTQGLGELDDKIKASSLDFKINLPQTKILAYADGKLIWRALENLLFNVFKYSLAKSRVYIDVFEDDDNAYIEVKNISEMELNIPEDEILERFKRGDESRSSDGNGLGLDIAKSLMACQNGELIIKIDGDLFKAKLKIPKPVKTPNFQESLGKD